MRKDILPAGPLMKEHRIIERMVKLIEKKLKEFSQTKRPDSAFINAAVDFLKTYADKCHHGKEEDILFAGLKNKKISEEHVKIMERLIADHRFGRKAVNELKEANKYFMDGDESAMEIILARMKDLADLYPPHIKTEDKDFFLPCMEYFSSKEQQEMLEKFSDFDRQVIHDMYREVVERLEEENGHE